MSNARSQLTPASTEDWKNEPKAVAIENVRTDKNNRDSNTKADLVYGAC